VDLAFWFTFAGYKFVPGTGSRRDLDLASYGVVKMVPGGPGAGALFCALSRSRRGIARLRGVRSASEEPPCCVTRLP
jgi:hypothetical protein